MLPLIILLRAMFNIRNEFVTMCDRAGKTDPSCQIAQPLAGHYFVYLPTAKPAIYNAPYATIDSFIKRRLTKETSLVPWVQRSHL